MRPQDLGIGKLFNTVRDAVIAADAGTEQIVLWNPAATRIFGYSLSEALEMRVETLVPEYLKAQHQAGMSRYAKTGHGSYIDSHRPLELPALRKSGEEIYIELSLSPIRPVEEADGERLVLAIVRDITERKRAEEEIRYLNETLEKKVSERTAQLETVIAELEENQGRLRESEERFRSLVQNASDLITVIDGEGIIRYASPTVERVLGYLPQEMIGTSVLDYVHPDDLEKAVSTLAEIKSEPGGHSSFELRVPHKDGSWRYLESMVNNLLEDSSVRGIVVNQRDITDRKRAEKTLRESEERFRATFEQAAGGIAHVAPDGKWLRVNQKLCDIVGYTCEELLEKTFQDITHPEDLDPDLEQARRLLAGEIQTYSIEKRYIKKDSSSIWSHLTASLVRDLEGKPEYFILVIEDISERKKLERRLEHQAFHDSLTGLPNRALFLDRLQQALSRLARYQAAIAVLFLDLDGFKSINDRFGHDVGDQLLISVAERLKGCLRNMDTAARLGGDEFIVLIEDITGTEDAIKVANRIAEELRVPFASEAGELFVTASIGIAFSTRSEDRPRELLRCADQAMYQSKSKGKAHYTLFDPKI